MSKFYQFASVISEIEQSDVFMTVKARICETPAANLNGARVTVAFIDSIISNEKRYVGLPLYADVKALTGGQYNRLGHLYDSKTGEFHSTQIGSFYKFEKEDFENGSYLIGYARIPKRGKKLSKAIAELFAEGALKFSFELAVGEYTELDDGTIEIDASEHNYLEGTAIVSYPACEEAVALELVAQRADDENGGETEMAEAEKLKTEEAEAEQETKIAEEETKENQEKHEESKEEPEEENASCEDKDKKKENADVYVREVHEESMSTHAYDTETGMETHQHVEIETETGRMVEGTLVDATDGVHVAQADGDTTDSGTNNPEPTADPAAEETPETNEDPTPDSYDHEKKVAEQIAELTKMVEEMKKEIATLEEMKQIVAELKKPATVTAEINPLMDDMKISRKYSLLEKESKTSHYTLLSK